MFYSDLGPSSPHDVCPALLIPNYHFGLISCSISESRSDNRHNIKTDAIAWTKYSPLRSLLASLRAALVLG
jgi:hypothetical protein